MRLHTTARAALDRACPPTAGRRLGGLGPAELRDHGEAGLVWRALHFGDHRIDRSGHAVESVPGETGWEAFLTGQVLPLCAVLQGLEPLHAGAVAIDGAVVAVTGPSGVGKSSVVAALLERGAGFFSDDVVTLEMADGGVIAHPGPAELKLRSAEGDVRVPAPAAAAGPLPLGALVLLERGPEPSAARAPLDVAALLGANFVPIVSSPDRLAGLLELCSAVASTARCLRVTAPSGGAPGAVADALLGALG